MTEDIFDTMIDDAHDLREALDEAEDALSDHDDIMIGTEVIVLPGVPGTPIADRARVSGLKIEQAIVDGVAVNTVCLFVEAA